MNEWMNFIGTVDLQWLKFCSKSWICDFDGGITDNHGHGILGHKYGKAWESGWNKLDKMNIIFRSE